MGRADAEAVVGAAWGVTTPVNERAEEDRGVS